MFQVGQSPRLGSTSQERLFLERSRIALLLRKLHHPGRLGSVFLRPNLTSSVPVGCDRSLAAVAVTGALAWDYTH